MKKCDTCRRTIIFGGHSVGAGIYCTDRCREKGLLELSGTYISDKMVADRVRAVQEAACPRCGGAGPNDLQKHYTIWSLIIVTSFKDVPEICCRRCGVKKSVSGFLYSFFLGWWGFPFGLLVTPIQLIRNIVALFQVPRPGRPTKNLQKLVRIELGTEVALTKQELEGEQIDLGNVEKAPAMERAP